MTLPFEIAGKLALLDRSRRHLVKSGVDLHDLNRQVLLDGTTEFVLGQARSGPPCVTEAVLHPTAGLKLLWEARGRIRTAGWEVLSQLEQALNPDGPPGALRKERVAPCWSNHLPLDPELIPRSLERFFDWIQAVGFLEMHPVEQMTLSQIRLCEILPFQSCSVPLATVFSWSFLLEKKYLVPSYAPDQRPVFDDALGQAFNFSTLDLLALNSDACQRSYPESLSNPV